MAYGPLLFQLASFLCEKSLLKCGFHRICTSFIFLFLSLLLFSRCFCCLFVIFVVVAVFVFLFPATRQWRGILVSRWLSVCPFVCPSVYFGITLAVRVSVRLSVRLSYVSPSVFSFPDDNLSGCQWIFAKLDTCIDIVEIWFGIVYGQIYGSYLPARRLYFHFRVTTSKCQWISPNLMCALVLWRPGSGLQMGKFRQFFVSCLSATLPYFHFWTITSVNINGFSPNLGLLMGKYRLF